MKACVFITGIIFSSALLVSCSTSLISLNRAEMNKIDTVGIMEFDTTPGISKTIATECEEAFRGHFVGAGKKVVERSKLTNVIKEIERSQSGIVSSYRKIGELTAADALLFGTVTQNGEEVKWVDYFEYEKNPITKEMIKIKKSKQKKFFTFQVQARLISTESGSTIMTIKNEYPERSYEMTDSMTLTRCREYTLDQMGRDIKKAIEKKE